MLTTLKRFLQKINGVHEKGTPTTNVSETSKLKYLPLLYPTLTHGKTENKHKEIKQITELLSSLQPEQLAKTDYLCRNRSLSTLPVDWNGYDPGGIVSPDFTVTEKIYILGFFSFHPNGYIREKAVRRLTKINTFEIVPFILIRLNDWVDKIRRISYEAVDTFLKPEFAIEFIKIIQLVERLSTCSRVNHTEIISKIYRLISDSRQALDFGLKFHDPTVRGICFKIAINSRNFRNAEIFDLIRKDRSGQVRRFALNAASKRINPENRKELLNELLDDKNARVGALALDLYCKYDLKEASDVLLKQLFSKYAGVRVTAAFYLKKLGVKNIGGLYRKELLKNSDSGIGTILGLGETGNPGDSRLIVPYLKSNDGKRVIAAAKTLRQLKMEDLASLLLPYFGDTRPGVSKEVSGILMKYKSEITAEEISGYLSSDRPVNIRKNAFQIIACLNQYDSLPYILQTLKCRNSELKYIAEEALKKWLVKAGGNFTKPTEVQIQKIISAINKTHIDKKYIDAIQFILNKQDKKNGSRHIDYQKRAIIRR